MKTLLSTIFAIFLSLSIYGQTNYFEYKSVKSEDCEFPIFSSSVDSLTANKINQTLQLLQLNLLEGFQTKTIFEEIRLTEFEPKIIGSRTMEFEILENNKKVLSTYFNESSCNATCHYWNCYFNFNSQNGNLINIEDLFTKKGLASFKKLVSTKSIKKLKKQSNLTEKEYRNEYILEYTGFLTDPILSNYYIKNNAIIIDNWNILDKNIKVSGVNLVTKYSISEFKNYLSEFGKYIFLNSMDSLNLSLKPKTKLYKGTIAGKNVLFILDFIEKNKVSGKYVYLQYGKAMDIIGDNLNNKIILTETNNNGDITGYLSFILTENKIIGTWTDKHKSKKFKLVAEKN